MKKTIAFIALLSLLITCGFDKVYAQIVTPVTWTWKAVQTGKGEYKLIFTAKIDKKWHTYSQYIGDGGPVPTKFTYDEKNKDVQLIGNNIETSPNAHDIMDPQFNMRLKIFEDLLVCTQVVKVLKDTKLKGTLEFMVCDDSRCLPPDDKDFEFDLKAGSGVVKTTPDKPANLSWIIPEHKKQLVRPWQYKKHLMLTHKPVCKMAMRVTDSAKSAAAAAMVATTSNNGDNRFGKALSNCNGAEVAIADKSWWAIMLLGFAGGLVALLTPCVFPMIPLTVSFFTKRSESKTKGKFEAFVYAFSIVGIYVLLALPFALWNVSSDTLNELSTGAALNVFFFVILHNFCFFILRIL